MTNRTTNNIKLGAFVLAGLLLLITGLYMIGKDSNLFGHNFELKARFDNVQGLTAGNNVRYAGIQVGTVKRVKILSDTVIEITMLVEEKMKPFIHKTDKVSISTDGLMGNKLINILPSKDNSPLAQESDILPAKRVSGTEEMMQTLDQTNNNLAVISENIKRTAMRINQSNAFWKILESPDLANNLALSAANIRNATEHADNMVMNIDAIIADTRNGKGSLGAILTDTSMVHDLTTAINSIKKVGEDASNLAGELSTLTQTIKTDISGGKGPAHFLLKDTALVISLNNSMNSIEQGTAAFNENMEALKHNFLLRGYFKKQEKKKNKHPQ